jgi:hypothetical protein
MSYEALLTEGSIRKQTPDPGSIRDLLAGAERDLGVLEGQAVKGPAAPEGALPAGAR